MSIGLLFVIIAWCIGIFRIGSGHYTGHFAIGTLAFLIALLQPINAVFRPHAPKEGEAPTRTRRVWNTLHHWAGRSAIFCAFVNFCLGLKIVGAGSGAVAIFAIVVIVYVFIFVYLECKSRKSTPFVSYTHPDEQVGGTTV